MITKIEILADDVHVHFDGENSEIFPNIWLRDHAKDEQNWDKRSSQRKTYTAALDINLKVKKAEIIENGKYLSVSWPDLEKPVKYSSEFLTNNKIKKKKEIKSNLKIWKSNEIKKDEQNWDKRSSQRKTYTAALDINLKVKKAEIIENGKYLSVSWPDLEKPVKYSSEFLTSNKIKKKKGVKSNLKIWKSNEIKKEIFLDYNSILSNEGFRNFLKNLHDYGFSVIKNCETNLKSVETIANKIGYVRNSIFGGLWSFESDENKADSAYTQEELRPHTDSTYSNDAPGLQLLLCCEYDAKGGESIMVDGLKIAETIKKENKLMYDLMTQINVKGNYIGDGVYLEAERPIFKLNENNEIAQVSFNNYDRAPFRFEKDLTLKFYEAIKKFDLIANNKDYQWRYILKPGELLIFNNWRILHGRGSFNGVRKMSGCYINKEDFDSSCRLNKIN